MMRVILSILIIGMLNLSCITKANDSISDAIDLYKAGNYKECITKCSQTIQTDPTSALGYYYLALSYAQTGQKDLAIKNYNKVIALGSDKTLSALAKEGKSKLTKKAATAQITSVETMLDDPDEPQKATQATSKQTTEEGQTTVSKENVKEVPKEQKQVSTTKQTKPQTKETKQPTNDEIVNALRVLQKAGLLPSGLATQQPQQQQPAQAQQQYPQQNAMPPNYQAQMDERTREMQAIMMMLNSSNGYNNGYNNGYDMMNMLPYMQNGGKMSPQMIQMMMMRQMMPDFSSGNNNGY